MSRKDRTPPPADLPIAPTDAPRQNTVIAALFVGLVLWLLLPDGPSGEHAHLATWRWVVAAVAAAFVQNPAVRRALARLGNIFRTPTTRRRTHIAVGVAIAASTYFVLTALAQDRDFFPKTHDECVYVIQMRMLATGRLWMPQHPLADFFESFYLLTKPVYASIIFPGTAILYVPGVWLHWPTWVLPVIAAGVIVGLVYRIVTELVDGTAGALAALLIVSLSWYRMLSIMVMSQLPALLFGLLITWAWLRWRGSGLRWTWLVIIGACAGWAAITRPVDALVMTLPVAAALLIDLRALSWSARLRALAIPVLAALPFLAVQAVFDRGVTGRVTGTPFGLYMDRDLPGGAYGFHPVDPEARPQSVIVQKQLEYAAWAKGFIQRHQPGQILADWWTRRLPLLVDATLPARVLLVLLPAGLLAARGRRWIVLATLPLFVIGYVGYAFFLEHYTMVIVPAIALLVVLGIRAVPERGRLGIIAAVTALAVTNLWEVNRPISVALPGQPDLAVTDEPFRSTLLRELHGTTEMNAIILFTFDLDPADPALVEKISQEPVYNTDVAWPDDARVIRAHDLGDRNGELFRYYATRSPERRVYRFSRRTGQVQDLGLVRDLAANPPPSN